MPKKKSHITITDQFCGAGGSSQGARNYGNSIGGGVEIKLALNHWKLAIETHNTNFPETDHDCTDISASDPRRYCSTDILITSPECTNHSLAKGQKIVQKQMDMFASGVMDASAERSRATMWDVCRFAEYHNYNCIIVENVVDARKWVMFDAWLAAMYALGYIHKCVYLNSMFCYPTPQSRDRMYIVFWKKKNKAPKLEFTPKAYCQKCEKDISAIQTWKDHHKQSGKYKQQYVYCCSTCTSIVNPYYHAAFNCIDWSDVGTRIGDRKKELSPNTIKRIEFGLKKYGRQPIIIHRSYEHVNAISNARSVTEEMQTQACRQTMAIVTPFIVDGNYDAKPSRASSIKEELPTNNTHARLGIAMPFIVENKNHSKTKEITDPAPCVTTKPHLGIITSEAWNAFIHYNYGSDTLSHIYQPLGTATTKDRHSVISYNEPTVDDCFYRMLKPKEIKLAMAFDHNYTVLGSGKDQVKQLGNAVTPPAMEWLVKQCIESLN